MVNPVSHATQAQAQVQAQVATQSSEARQPAPAPRPPQPAPAPQPRDTVQISAAAQALQETLETSAQTAHEASSGDPQAARLLAKQAAAHVARK